MSLKPSNPIWDWITFSGLVLAVFHLMALWYRWLRPDPEFLAFSTGVIQLLAISSFLGFQTESGKKLVLRLDDTLSLGGWAKSPARVCISAWSMFAILAILLYFGSPLAAQIFRQRGADAFENGEFSQAIDHFKQAVSLTPGNARAHYNLANAHEQIYDYDQAIAEYQIALELDDSFLPAYNNLGRLHLIARNDSDAALATLLSGERRVDEPLSKAIMAKNIARAFLEKGLPGEALRWLESSGDTLRMLQANGERVEVYLAETEQLLAKTHQRRGDEALASSAWQNSLGYALSVSESNSCVSEGSRLPPDCILAVRLAAEAREMLVQTP